MCKKIVGIFLLLITYVFGYKPVFLLHGILTGKESMLTIAHEIIKAHPGTKIYVTNRFSGWGSLENAWYQVDEIGKDIQTVSKNHPEGIHLLGYSQGGLLGRAVLESFSDLNIKTFISLSSPQAGQYGSAFLNLIFPNMVDKTAYELFYSEVGQHTSVGNYWNDPRHQELYYKFSRFLPYLNNALNSTNSTMFRNNLLKIDKMILIGGPDDNVITPWQSSQFGYYDEECNVISMESRDIFKDDKIGLKTLKDLGKLEIITISDVNHLEWHRNKTVIREAIIPFLD